MCLIHRIGGAFRHQPGELKERLSIKASDLVKRAYDDIDSHRLIDYHTHIAGIGTGDSNTFVNSKMLSWAHPFHHLKFKVYMSAGGVKDVENADAEMIERLVNLVTHIEQHAGIGCWHLISITLATVRRVSGKPSFMFRTNTSLLWQNNIRNC
ncbi:MAG: hypothetical protein ACREBC_12245, partial [Pyrinomonadaceae bacterium]